MMVIIEVNWFKANSRPVYEALEIHSGWPKIDFYWLIDRDGIRPRWLKLPFALGAIGIDHFAVANHSDVSCSLLMFSKSRFPTRRVQPDSQTPFELREPEYIELGTTFSGSEAAKMIAGIRRLGYQLLEFSWPELLDRIHRRAVVE